MFIVQVRNSLAKRLDPRRRSVFTRSRRDRNSGRAGERSLNAVVGIRCTLSQVRPGIGIFCESMLASPFCRPDYTGGGTGGIEAGVGTVAFVSIAKLTMGFGCSLCSSEEDDGGDC